MKRVCVLLLACMCVSGAFAQTLGLGGSVETGIAVFFPEGQDATVSLWSPREGMTARASIVGMVSNQLGTAGAEFEIRSEGPYHANLSSLYFQSARAWFKAWDKRITFIGGKLDDSGVFRTWGGIDEEDMAANDFGLHMKLENIPVVPGLTFGFTLMPGATSTLNGNTTNYLNMADYRFALRYDLEELAGVTTLFYANRQTALYEHTRLHSVSAVDVEALKSFGFIALRADVGFYDLQDADYFNMKTGQLVTFRYRRLEVGGRLRQSMVLGDINADGDYCPELLFAFHAVYLLGTGAVRPRLEVGYLYGGSGGNPQALSPGMRSGAFDSLDTRSSAVNPAAPIADNRLAGFREDTAYMSILPQVEFRTGGSGAFVIGGGPLYDLSAGGNTLNYVLFTNLRAVF